MSIAVASSKTISSLEFGDFLSSLPNEPQWLTEARRAAFETYLGLPWPTLKDEEWRRTDIRSFKLGSFPLAQPVSAVSLDEINEVGPLRDKLAKDYATGIVQIGGLTTQPADISKLGKAVLCDFQTALATHGDLVRDHLSRIVGADEDALSALHAAMFRGGVVLYVPQGVKLEVPLYVLSALTARHAIDTSHTLIILEDGAEATLVHDLTSVGDQTPGLHLGAVEISVRAKAHLKYVRIQNWNDQTWHFSRERAVVGAGGSIQWTIGGLGSRLSKVNQETSLTGPKASAQVNGVMFTTGKQHLAYFTRQDHQADHTTSDLLYKGGLTGKSRTVWKGMIAVDKVAQKTDAYQKNDSLVLSDQARADSIPGLEIEANDVRCTHGATAGPVDPEMVYYCQARGIPAETAKRLVVEGFFANVYDRISVEPVRESLQAAVAKKLALGQA
ncbi:MAG: Fe-S cluster assembly protein SufD [Isosphaeraceae bacterium]